MDARSYPIETVFGGEKQFTVPRFQRGYRWKQEEHWEPLWEELEDMAERLLGGHGVDSYYLGAIVVQPMPARGFRPSEYQVVDGQQRLTTLQVLLAALRDVCAQAVFPHQIKVTGLIQNHEVDRNLNPSDLFKVWPTDIDREVFRILLSADPKNEIDQRWPTVRRGRGSAERPGLVRAYTYFRNELNEFAHGRASGEPLPKQESWKRLERFLEVIRQKIQLVSIELGSNDDPMMIFEALNGRAEPLLPSDLIKNAVLRSAGADAERLHDLYWKQFGTEGNTAGVSFWQGEHKRGRLKRSRLDLFLTDYLQFNTQTEVKTPDLFKHFSNWWKSKMRANPPEMLLKTMVAYSHVYQRLLTADRTDNQPSSIFCANIRLMDFTLAYPLLLALLKELPDESGIVSDDVPGILRDLESYLVRRAVCGLTGKKYNYVFPEILKSLRETRGQSEIVTRETVRKRMLEFAGETVEWPDDRKFSRAWCEDQFYGRLPTAYLKVIFARIAEGRRGRYKEPVQISYDGMSVEHLMPQDWKEHWSLPTDGGSYRGESETPEQRRERMIQTIGNLTLLGQPLNSAVNNGAWPVKREQIRQHGLFSLNSDFTNLEKWDEASISARSKALWTEAASLWPFPKQADASMTEYNPIFAAQSTSPVASAATATPVAATISTTSSETVLDGKHFRQGTNYWAIVESLKALGVDRMHGFDAIITAVQNAMGEGWNEFANREARLSADERIIQNIEVIKRPEDAYGGRLLALGLEVRIDKKNKTAGLFSHLSLPT